MARREKEIRALMMREFQKLYPRDSDLDAARPRWNCSIWVDGMIAIAIHDERERSGKAATKVGGDIRYTEPRWTP